MIGFAVELRCPYCRDRVAKIATEPDAPPVHISRKCRSRACRKARREETVYSLEAGRVRVLTGDERAAIVRGSVSES